MPANDSALTRSYAFKITLIYLLIRGIPDLVMCVFNFLPAETARLLATNYGAWLDYVYPVLPVHVLSVPLGFQQALAVLPVLIIEVLLVFLFSTLFLRHKPWLANSSDKRRWIVLILAIAVWAFAIRHQLLMYIQSLIQDELVMRMADMTWLDGLSFLVLKAHWIFMVVVYVTTPLWAGLPIWLHFRFAKMSAAATTRFESDQLNSVPVRSDVSGETSLSGVSDATGVSGVSGVSSISGVSGATGLMLSLDRATAFAGFLLGCVTLHFVLIQVVYMGLWPWAVDASQVPIPTDVHKESGLALSLSQIVFATLMCAVAATVYVRRLATRTTALVRHRILKSVLSGIATYLLTSLVFLALVWFVIWLSPDLVNQLVQEFSYDPGTGVAFIIALNIGALVLLCVMSDRFGASPRIWSGVMVALIACVAIPSYVGWVIAGSNMGIRGGKPGFAVTGELAEARLRSMEQWCTGVTETRQGTWLVGRSEISSELASHVPTGVPDLAELVLGEGETYQGRGFGLFGSRPLLTTLSLLQDDGTFKVMATIPEVACLVVSPESETMYLFTGVSVPLLPQTTSVRQTAIYRSLDHGMTWEWLESGLMPSVNSLAWGLKPIFTSDDDIWAWGKEPPGEDDATSFWRQPAKIPTRRAADGTEHRPTALHYSSDQGKTSTVIYSPEPLVAPSSYLQELVGEPTARFSSSRSVDQRRFIAQVDDHRAYAWVSESTWYHVGERSERLMLTTRAELVRPEPDGEWSVTRVTREPGVVLAHLSTSLDGQTYAVLRDNDGEWLVALDSDNGEWTERQRTPSLLPGWLVGDDTSVRYFWSNGDYQVISKWGYVHVPRIFMPFSRESAEINVDAHYYTRDGGRSWNQLAIPGYLGVMGLSRQGSKVYWSKGNWYSNDESQQWEYDLAK